MLLVFAILFIIVMAVVIGVWVHLDSLPVRAARAAARGHDAEDSRCTYWAGDFAGVRLSARCPICDPEEPWTDFQDEESYPC